MNAEKRHNLQPSHSSSADQIVVRCVAIRYPLLPGLEFSRIVVPQRRLEFQATAFMTEMNLGLSSLEVNLFFQDTYNKTTEMQHDAIMFYNFSDPESIPSEAYYTQTKYLRRKQAQKVTHVTA